MLTVEQIAKQIDAMRQHGDIDRFEDWFHEAARGYRGPKGHPLFDAVAAIDVVLSAFSDGDVGEPEIAQEMTAAIRPFVDAWRKGTSRRMRFSVEVKSTAVNYVVDVPDHHTEPREPSRSASKTFNFPLESSLPKLPVASDLSLPVPNLVAV